MSNTFKVPLIALLCLVIASYFSHTINAKKVKILVTYCIDSTCNDSSIVMADSSTFKQLLTWQPAQKNFLLYHDCWGTDEFKIASPQDKDLYVDKNSWYVVLNYKIVEKK